MPCSISDEELRFYERAYNDKHYGVNWTNHELTTAVACWLSKHIKPDERIPTYVVAWIESHQKKDA